MPNGFRPTINPFSSFQSVSNARVSVYGGINRDRQSRFQARSARRWGDWSILEFPIPVLWLDYEWEPLLLDEPAEFISPVVVELWP